MIIKVNLNDIPKDRIFEGEKGRYVDLVIFPYKNGPKEWGDTHYVQVSISKEERESGVEPIFCGSGRSLGGKAKERMEAFTETDDDLPF